MNLFSGISEEEKEILEAGFRSNALRVMVATSTLSSGVNLPARAVLICFSRYLSQMMYQQMAGRAGRMGIDSAGNFPELKQGLFIPITLLLLFLLYIIMKKSFSSSSFVANNYTSAHNRAKEAWLTEQTQINCSLWAKFVDLLKRNWLEVQTGNQNHNKGNLIIKDRKCT
jgi:ATP-dependent helicase YprA (DUF1998 family)